MWRRLWHGLGTLLLAGTLVVPSLAQPPAQSPKEATEGNIEAPKYVLAFLAAVLVLLIICMPSRKQ